MSIPSEVTARLVVADSLVLLLDGLDELDDESAERCLAALGLFANPVEGRHRRLALTCRSVDYQRIVDRRAEVGTAAVANALRILPLPLPAVIEILGAADPPAGQLENALRHRSTLAEMVGLPLWLSIAYLVYRVDPLVDPLSTLDAQADDGAVGTALYERWLPLRLADAPPPTRAHLAALADAMRTNFQETLYLDAVQPDWGEALVPDLPERARRRFSWLMVILFALLLLPVLWLVDGARALAAGVVFVVIGASLPAAARAQRGNHLVLRRVWRPRPRRVRLGPALAIGVATAITVAVLWGLAIGWRAAWWLGIAVGVVEAGAWWIGTSFVEDDSAPEREPAPRNSLVRSRRAGFAAALWGSTALVPLLGLVLFSMTRLADDHTLAIGRFELSGRAAALLLLLPVVAVASAEAAALAREGMGWELPDFMVVSALFVGLPLVAGVIVGGLARIVLDSPGLPVLGGMIGLAGGLWFFWGLFGIGRLVTSETNEHSYPISFTVVIGLAAVLGFASPPAAAIIGVSVGVAGGLAVGVAGGLGPPIGYRLTVSVCASERVLPQPFLRFLERACELGVMYPTGPGFRFRHRTLAEMLAHGRREE